MEDIFEENRRFGWEKSKFYRCFLFVPSSLMEL